MRRFFENEIALFSISIVNGRAREAEICEPAPDGRGRGAERGSRLYPPVSPSGPLPTLGTGLVPVFHGHTRARQLASSAHASDLSKDSEVALQESRRLFDAEVDRRKAADAKVGIYLAAITALTGIKMTHE